MEEMKLKKFNSGLVIVAHPDDETIWCGGLFLRFPKVKWTVFSLCRRSDRDRQPKFLKVMKKYCARAIMTDLEDEGIMTVQESIPIIKKIILKNLKKRHFDYLFSHNIKGEYGHDRHVGVHLAVKELLSEKKIIASQNYFFSYKTNWQKKIFNDKQKASRCLNLTAQEWRQKKDIINNLYGFSKKTFEYQSCLKKETYILK